MSSSIESLIGSEYQHGFSTDIETDSIPRGLSEDVVRSPLASLHGVHQRHDHNSPEQYSSNHSFKALT